MIETGAKIIVYLYRHEWWVFDIKTPRGGTLPFMFSAGWKWREKEEALEKAQIIAEDLGGLPIEVREPEAVPA